MKLFLSVCLFGFLTLTAHAQKKPSCDEIVASAVLNTTVNTMFGKKPTKAQLDAAQQSMVTIRDQYAAAGCGTIQNFNAKYHSRVNVLTNPESSNTANAPADRRTMTKDEAAAYDRWLQAEGKYITGDTSIAPGRETPAEKARARKVKSTGAR